MTQSMPWLKQYPDSVPAELDTAAFPTLTALLDDSLRRYPQRTAFSYMGSALRYADLDAQSRALAAYFQTGLGLQKGERIALMMPNVPQYPVAVLAALRAGLVVVNVNPLYTARELEHQLQDSGAKAIVIMENFAATLQQCLARTGVQHVVLARDGQLFAIWLALGSFLAAPIFASSVVAMPLMLDRRVTVRQAVLTSWLAVLANPVPLALWAALIVLLTLLGLGSWLLGLVAVMPLLGHASWHAYRDLVDASTFAAR